ncbi:MAG: 4Fe-4S binding protein [Acidobacteria bacterium]|nr:4Fe-4S binding protein [Acidobacteriota bacterium]
MSDLAVTPVSRGIGRSLLLTLPIALWALLMFSRALQVPGTAPKLAALLTFFFSVTLFYLMVKTRKTNRWRRVFFATLGFLFPVGFVWELIALRGSMSIPMEKMIAGDTPFCFMVIPMILLPAALTGTVIFPGSILPTASNPHSIAVMIGLWLAATLVLGKAWCAYGCFFGGIEEGVAALPRKARIRKIDSRWRLVPWAVLAAIVLLSLATFAPTYCEWLCPFKTVTEFAEVRSLETAIQTGIFLSLFFGLVIVLPWLTKKRTQCAFFCPFGAFPVAVQQDPRVRHPHPAREVQRLRLVPEQLPDHGAQQAVGRGRQGADQLHALRRLRGRLPQGRRGVAHQGHTRGRGARARPPAASVRRLGLRRHVRRQHHRRRAQQDSGIPRVGRPS